MGDVQLTARALALLLLLAAPCQAQTTPLAVYATASAIDLAQSSYLFGSGGYHEGNPAMAWATHHPEALAIGKVAAASLTIYAVREMKKQGHPKAARIVAWAAAAAQVAIVVRGYKQTREARR